MPIEDLQMPKAPANWQPTADQRRMIEADPRLRGLGRDDLYFFFNKQARPAAQRAAPAPRPKRQQPTGGLLGATLDRVTGALRGANRR